MSVQRSQHDDPFEKLASQYASCRSTYPSELFATLAAWLSPDATRDQFLIVDVAAGTGIATRMLRRTFAGARVIGVEPSAAMLDAARQTTSPSEDIFWVRGRAESLPCATASAQIVLAAQALHWFDRDAFYREAARLLRPRGVLAILHNNRDWRQSALMDSLETLLERHSPGYTRDYREFEILAETMRIAEFVEGRKYEARWVRTLTRDALEGMLLSSTRMQAAITSVGKQQMQNELWRILDAFATHSEIAVPYITELFVSRRR